MNKKRIVKWVIKVTLFTLILIGGTLMALVTDEEEGLARVDLPDSSFHSLAPAGGGTVLYAGAESQTAESGGLYRSLDNGRNWQIMGPGPQAAITTLTARPGSEAILYAGGAGGPLAAAQNLWRSEDNGRTWQRFNLTLPANPDGLLPPVTALATDPNQPGVLYVGADGQGVYRLEENRLGYELVGGLTLANGHVRELVVGPGGQLYALTGGGLFVYNKASWQPVEALPEFPVSLLIAPAEEPRLYAGGASGGIYRSNDGGESWQTINTGVEIIPGAALRVTALAVDEQSQNSLAAATAYGIGRAIAPGHLYRSDDGGTHWVKIATLESQVNHLTLNNGTILAATEKGVLRYGKSYQLNLETASPATLTDLPALARPSGLQSLILLLTLTLAGLVFVIPLDRLLRGKWFNRLKY